MTLGNSLDALRRSMPPGVVFGTSSWNYPGWQGLVYHQAYPEKGASAPMLEEYACYPLFGTVGIDQSFYAPLSPKLLEDYARRLPPGFRCVSKVWDRLTVHTVAKARDKAHAGQANPDFLNPELFVESVLTPCLEHFAEHIGPFVFEFQAIPRKAMDPAQFANHLDTFFGALPRTAPYAVEVRNAEFLTSAYFAVLREHNVAHLFNSWTKMPSIGMQLDLPGSLTADFLVARALLRPGRWYSDAVDAFAPYDKVQDENPELRQDLARLVRTAAELRIPAYVLVNNRAEGCAPKTIEAVMGLVTGP